VTSPQAHTFLFADLAGFTALTEVHGDEHAADVAGSFCDAVRALLPEYGAEEVKTIGDALMIRAAEATSGAGLAMRIVNDVGVRHGHPTVRAGINTGPAVARDGDWFGTTVNVAARVTELAAGGEVVATAATREAAGDLPDVDFQPRGRHELRNVAAPVELFTVAARSDSANGFPIDPVCQMAVDPAHSPHRLIHRGVKVHFCSQACAEAFVSDPDRYVRRRSRG
jgi:adenylate cyclase